MPMDRAVAGQDQEALLLEMETLVLLDNQEDQIGHQLKSNQSTDWAQASTSDLEQPDKRENVSNLF